MLQSTESEVTPPTEASVMAPPASEMVSKEAETRASDLDAELAELAACMAGGVATRTSRIKTFLKRYFACTAAFIVVDLAWISALRQGNMVPDTLPKILLLFLVLLSIPTTLISSVLWLLKDRTTKQEYHAAQRLLEIDDVRAVAPLLDALGWTRKRELSLPLWEALMRLLPKMTEDEAQALGNERQYILAVWIQNWDIPLNRRMRSRRGIEGNQPLLGLLHVLALLGQSSFQTRRAPFPVTVHILSTLQKWAEGKGSGQDPEVQQAAIACREAIQQKMALARTGEQLLRASAPTPAGSDTLLRPTEGTQQTDPQELLRPGDPE